MDAVYGKTDCWTFAFGSHPRPAALVAGSDDAAYRRALRVYGSPKGIAEGIAAEMPSYSSVDGEWLPGDIVVGASSNRQIVIAKISTDYLPICRTEIGHDVVTFVEVFGVWRKECPKQQS